MKNALTANEFYKRQIEYAKLAFEKDNLLPRRYVLVLTNLCNLRCTFCFQERKKRPDHMTTEDWLKFIEQIPNNSRVTLTGGEPLVYKDFDKIFQKCNENKETNIITNGLLLSNQKVEKLLEEKNFKVLSISIDTIGNVNRDFKKNQWSGLVDQIKKFVSLRDKKEHKSALDIKTVILDENIEDLFNIHKLVMEDLKADTHNLQILKGAEIQHSDLMFDFKDIEKETRAYQYKKFDTFIDQLNKILPEKYEFGKLEMFETMAMQREKEIEAVGSKLNEARAAKINTTLGKSKWRGRGGEVQSISQEPIAAFSTGWRGRGGEVQSIQNVTVNMMGDTYGMDDFDSKVAEAVRGGSERGGFQGVWND